MRSGNFSFVALLLSVGLFPTRTAHADVLFTTMPYLGGTQVPTVPINGPTAPGVYFEVAEQFTLSTTSSLTSADVAFFHYTDTPNNPLILTIYDTVNGLPGTALTSGVIPSIADYPTAAIYTVNFPGNLVLTAGTPYFLDASTAGNGLQSWLLSQSYQTGPLIPQAYRLSPTGAFTVFDAVAVAFQINGTPITSVPEPGFVTLLATSALTGAGFLARRRKQARQGA